MRTYRIYDHREDWADRAGANPLSGEGGLHEPARWHHVGSRIVYASASPSLAVLETLVWVPLHFFEERTLIELEVPDEHLEKVGRARMFRLVHDAPAEERERLTRDFGTNWLQERRSLGLVVPSAVMPMESNILLNPDHPEMSSVIEVGREVVTLDPRLFAEFLLPSSRVLAPRDHL